jgi:hypothetical protein
MSYGGQGVFWTTANSESAHTVFSLLSGVQTAEKALSKSSAEVLKAQEGLAAAEAARDLLKGGFQISVARLICWLLGHG